MPKESLRERILDAGLRVMFRSGYIGSGVRDIVAEAHAPQGSFTNHFRSKEAFAVEVLDPREAELPDAGHLVLVDPETGRRVEADSSSAELRRRFAAAELARRDTLKSHLRRAHARHVEIATNDDWLRALGRSLR